MNAPHVFHGISEEVIVPASSRARDGFCGASSRRANSARNMRPGSTTAMYWSEASTLVPKAAPTSVATRAPPERAAAINGPISRSRTPARSMKPPNASATRISQTVASMLAMPPRVSSWSIAGSPVLET